MKHHLIAAAIGTTAISVPSSSYALDYLFGGVSAMSEYVSQGLELSDGLSALTYLEGGLSGFYLGAYYQTADEDFAGYDWEAGPYVGYRGALGSFSYDASVYHYEFSDDVDSYQELILQASYAVTDAISVGAYYGYAEDLGPFTDQQDEWRVSASYATGWNDVTLVAEYGNADFDFGEFGSSDWDFWSIGADIPFADNWRAELRYNSSDAEDGVDGFAADDLFTIAIAVDFSLR
ncbi:hypothetical protein ROLI_013840 [Roseobacter fucihabitans]|uniref:Uncharacterized protein n=1 Tax=Roseobacter fucihabitans TaxID=1537242 RepID=A0ABZ2BQN3_9RHOB|nr:hypothetical protein [Roseobacter litoralis]MBC6967496.1 hypothetical protein [Roseobacter litoralis]